MNPYACVQFGSQGPTDCISSMDNTVLVILSLGNKGSMSLKYVAYYDSCLSWHKIMQTGTEKTADLLSKVRTLSVSVTLIWP